MGPARRRDLAATVVAAALISYILVINLYRWFPPLTLWTGLSLAGVAVAKRPRRVCARQDQRG